MMLFVWLTSTAVLTIAILCSSKQWNLKSNLNDNFYRQWLSSIKQIRSIGVLLLTLILTHSTLISNPPRSKPQLTIILVIDQFSAHQLKKVTPFLSGGIKKMLTHGTVYTNTRHPHGFPTTATGHTALNTGAFGKDHGITLNCWHGLNGKANCFVDDRTESLIFHGNHLYSHGASARNLMTEGLSDQFVKASTDQAPHHAIALSHKCRAAIGLSGKQGKPIWLDPQSLEFTSSKAFFDKLPTWVTDFNQKHIIRHQTTVEWPLAFHKNHKAYNVPLISNYQWSNSTIPLAGTTISCPVLPQTQKKIKRDGLPRSTTFAITPASNQLLLDLAISCLNHTLTSPDDHLLLWVSLSPLDRIGHTFGPYSREALDMIYHLDLQIGNFIKHVTKKFKHYRPFFTLTADHGVMPLPEKSAALGFPQGRRVNSEHLVQKLNHHAEKNFGIKKTVSGSMSNNFFINPKVLKQLEQTKQIKLLSEFKQIIAHTPGIKKAWTAQELINGSFKKLSPEYCIQQQLYPGRTGDLICLTEEWTTLSKSNAGATHKSPYSIDTHVPLIMYDPGHKRRKTISQPTFIPQLSVTLADKLGVARPPKATFSPLP